MVGCDGWYPAILVCGVERCQDSYCPRVDQLLESVMRGLKRLRWTTAFSLPVAQFFGWRFLPVAGRMWLSGRWACPAVDGWHSFLKLWREASRGSVGQRHSMPRASCGRPGCKNLGHPATRAKSSVHQFVMRNVLPEKHLRRIGSNWRGSAVSAVQVHDVRNRLPDRNFERAAE